MSENKKPLEPKKTSVLPNMFQMVKSFSKELVNYVKEGAPNVTTEDYADRLDVCNNCPNIIKQSMRCRLCGCAMQHKAKWTTSRCPDNPSRWKKQIIKDHRGNIIDEKTIEENLKKAQILKKQNEQRQENDNTNTSNKV